MRRKCLVGMSGKYRNKKVKNGKQDYREGVLIMKRDIMGRAASYRRIGLRMGEVEQGRMERKEV